MKLSYDIPELVVEETRQHAVDTEERLAGGLSEDMYKARRVPRGIYEQRQKGRYMVRVRLAGGLLWAEQARAVADLSLQYGRGTVHFTTRQDLQLHDLAIEDTHPAMEKLLETGLTPLGGGGNTVRNIAGCSHSGLHPQGVFDVLPYVVALTNYMLPQKTSYHMPRKFKIAFSCCPADYALARINDLGFIARIKDGRKGFAVYVGGGMGTHSRKGELFTDFLPAEDIFRLTEAVKELFVRFGDRRNRHRARLRFALEKMGWEKFKEELELEFKKAAAGVPAARPAEVPPFPVEAAAVLNPSGQALAGLDQGYEQWLARAVCPQQQEGYYYVRILLRRGDLSAADLTGLANLSEKYSGGQLRADRRQDLLLPHIPAALLPELYAELRQFSPGLCGEEAEPWMISCKGAATCSLGVCQAQGLNAAISEAVTEAGLPAALFSELEIHTSGCPNNCGQHTIAPLGFFGAVRRVAGRSYPVYNLVVGGGGDEDGLHLAEIETMLPARRVPPFTVELLQDFLNSGQQEQGFAAYWRKRGRETALELAERLSDPPGYAEEPEFYRDWGSAEDFSLAGRSQGECGAGVFELIAEELKKSESAFTRAEQGDVGDKERGSLLLQAAALAAGSLLVTKGIEPGDPDLALKEFERQFIDSNLTANEHRDLLLLARSALRAGGALLSGEKTAVRSFLDEVQRLYDAMDASLNFPVKGDESRENSLGAQHAVSEDVSQPEQETVPHQTLNLTGVACPMNFVHAKIALEQLPVGSILEVILDAGEPINNVPASFKDQGQEVLSITPHGPGAFRTLIRRSK